jgi:hypothetical protein
MKRLAWLAAIPFAVACGGSDDAADPDGALPEADAAAIDAAVPTVDAAPNRGFTPPTAVTTAFELDEENGFVEVGPANWDCLGEPDAVVPTEEVISVSGRLKAFGGGEGDRVAGAQIVVFGSTDFYGTPIAGPVTTSETELDGDGNVIEPAGQYEVELDPGVTRVAFRATAEGYLDTYSLNRSFAADATDAVVNLDIVHESLADVLAALALQRQRTQGLGIIAGSVVDCDGHTVRHAIATVSPIAGELEHLPGVITFYFNGNPNSPAPQRPRLETHDDGIILIPELEPTEEYVYVQVWGFPDQAAFDSDDLQLLSELETTIPEDGLLTSALVPLFSEPSNGGDEE